MVYTFKHDFVEMAISVLPYFLFFRCVYWSSFYVSDYIIGGYEKMTPGEKSLWGSAWCSSILSVVLPYLVLSISLENGNKWLLFDYPFDFKDDRIVEMTQFILGYFVADIIPCLQHRQGWGKDWYVFVVHHIAAMWYFYTSIYYEQGHGSLLSVCLMESKFDEWLG